MTVTIQPPKSVALATFTCDRCGKEVLVEFDPAPSQDAPDLPGGWQRSGHPDPGDMAVLTFDTRACMSTWYATWIRVLYGGPEELPKRRSRNEPDEPVTKPEPPLTLPVE